MQEKPNFVEGEEWFLTVTRNVSFWHNYLNSVGYFRHSKDFGLSEWYQQLFMTVDGTKTSMFASKENHEKYTKSILDATDTLEKVYILKKKYKMFAADLFKSLEKAKKNPTGATFKEFTDQYGKYGVGLMLTAYMGRIYTEKISSELRRLHVPESELANIVSVVSYPSDKNPYFESQADLFKMGKEIQEENLGEKEIDVKIEEWLVKHAHVPVNFCEEPYHKTDIKQQLDELLKVSCASKFKEWQDQHENNIFKAKQEIARINDPEITRIALTLAETTSLNEYRKGVFCKVSLEYRPIFTLVAKNLGSDNWRDCFYLKNEEIIDVLDGKKFDLDSIKKERQKIAMFVNKDGELVDVSKEKTEQLYNFVYNPKNGQNTEKVDSIKGFSANKGKVKGIARIILSSKDFNNLKPGEILVTTMTSVDFVPIMERAAAFVTNEGGITSHASIIAREMNKPCIIGTKIATQVIKDGDMVEVDADRGIITLLDKQV